MSWSAFETLLKATCKHVNESHKSASQNAVNIIGTGEALKTAFAGIDGNEDVSAAIKAERSSLNTMTANWRTSMNACLAYGGTQLGTPSKYVQGGSILNFAGLMRDINADMETNSRSIETKAITYAADPTADDDGIIERVTVDPNGEKIEGGIHAGTLDVEVTGTRATGLGPWQSVVTISGRDQGKDVFDNNAPATNLTIEAVNPSNNKQSIISNPNLISGINSRTDTTAVTTLSNWALSGSATHTVDTSILFRDNTLSHKIVGTGGATRVFTQTMKLNGPQFRYNPQKLFVPVYKTGTPTGNITIAWGSKSQVWTVASLSAGWNYLTPDNDSDIYPDNFDEAAATFVVTVECTTGDSSNYVNVGCILGTVAAKWNGVFHFHWSQNGTSALGVVKTIADSATSAGLNQTAILLAYNYDPDAYLRATGSPTIADYT